MKLLLTMNSPYFRLNGAAKGNRMVAGELAASGHSVTVVVPAFGADETASVERFEDEIRRRVDSWTIDGNSVRFTFEGVKIVAVLDHGAFRGILKSAIHSEKPDWVLVSSEDPTQSVLDAALDAAPDRVVYIAHTLLFLPFGPQAAFPSELRTNRIRRARGVIAVSRFVRDYIKTWSGLDSRVVYWPAYGKAPFHRLGRFDNPFVTIINPSAVKGFSIFSALVERCPHVEFAAVAGWGTTEAERAELGRFSNFRFVPASENIDDVFAETRALLVPSLWEESFGLVVVEAMLRGVPVLASNVGGLTEAKLGTDFLIRVSPIERFTDELDEHKLPKPVVPAQSVEPWADALKRLLDDRVLYESESEKAALVASEFVSGLGVEPLISYLRDLESKPVSAETPRLAARGGESDAASKLASLTPEQRALFMARLRKKSAQKTDVQASETMIPVLPRNGPLELSFAQERMWFLHRMEPESPAYHIAGAFRFRGRIDPETLEDCLAELIRRHEVLRTVFAFTDGKPVQVVRPPDSGKFEIERVAVEDFDSEAEAKRRLLEHVSDRARRPFDLENGPLLRVTLFEIGPRHKVLVYVMHHVVSDAWSIEIFVKELRELLTARIAGRPPQLPPLPIQYADFASWQRTQLSGDALERHLSFWKRHLDGELPGLDLHPDRPRPAVPTNRGAWESTTFSTVPMERISGLAKSEGCTMFQAVLSAFFVFLSRHADRDDVIVGTPIAGRTRPEVQNLIGFFVNTLPIRVRIPSDAGFRNVLKLVRETTLEVFSHQDLPFEKLVEALHPDRDITRTPFFQIVFLFNPAARRNAHESTDGAEEIDVPLGAAKFDLTFSTAETEKGLFVEVEYKTDLFDAATIRRMLADFERLLGGLVAEPDRAVSLVPLISDSEIQAMLAPLPEFRAEKRLHELFEEQAARTPDAVAVSFHGANVTYGELNAEADSLAVRLREAGAGPGRFVGLCVERSRQIVVGILGILKTGAAYVPIDPNYPQERIDFIVKDAGLAIRVQGSGEEKGSRFGVQGSGNTDWNGEGFGELNVSVVHTSFASETPNPEPRTLNPAYVIYTSGSTGKPKGVVVTHENVVRLFEATKEWFRFDASDVWTLFHSVAFDFSVWELWGALLYGGRLVVVDYRTSRSPEEFYELLIRERVTVLNQTPSAFRQLMKVDEERRAELYLRHVVFGGEALDVSSLAGWFERRGDQTPGLVNMYGITETTVHVTYKPLAKGDVRAGRFSPIGVPIPDLRLLVLDRNRQPMPVGVPGELYVGGAGVGLGYLNRPQLTEEKFIPNPFFNAKAQRHKDAREVGTVRGSGWVSSENLSLITHHSSRLYRTGDLGRRLADGSFEYLGRIDDQVKIRGFRIELGEIESALLEHPNVSQAVVLVRETDSDDRRLAAYVVVRRTSDFSETALREFLGNKLPSYMVPGDVAVLDALPLTPHGKIDRRALLGRETAVEQASDALSLPRTPIEEAVAEILASVLRRDSVGPDEDFFQIGGHSILAIQVVGRLRAMFDLELPLHAIFEDPTPTRLARRIETERAASKGVSVQTSIPRISRDGALPLSFAQERLWFLEKFRPGNVWYVIPAVVRLPGTIDETALEQAFAEIVRRHEILRTTFAEIDGKPVQVVHERSDFKFFTAKDTKEEKNNSSENLSLITHHSSRSSFLLRPFDLERGPLLRVGLFQTESGEKLLAFAVHHIVFDGWSGQVLLHELGVLYRAFSQGRPSPLPELPIQYADYAAWHRRRLSGERYDRELSYWTNQLADCPPMIELPTDRPRPTVRTYRGDRFDFEVADDIRAALKKLSLDESATLYMTLAAAFFTLLHRCSGQDDVSVGSPVANRGQVETERLIGFLLNTIVLRGRFAGDPTFREFLAQTRRTVLEAFDHQEFPFEKLVEALHPERDLSRTPLFQVMFVFQSAAQTRARKQGRKRDSQAFETESGGVSLGIAKFDLTLSIIESSDVLECSFEYNSDLFERETVKRMADRFTVLLEGITTNPDRRLSALPLLPQAEIHRLLFEWNATERDFAPIRCLHELFEDQAHETPDRIAVVSESSRLTFAELNDRADQLAGHLISLGIRDEAPVGVCLERSVEMVVAILGILKAGGAYVPIDPEFPPERIDFMLEDARLACVVTDAKEEKGSGFRVQGSGKNPYDSGCGLKLQVWETKPAFGSETPNPEPRTPNPAWKAAYILYTSGSTGKPKGVVIEHRQVVNYIRGIAERYGLEPGMTYAMVQPLTVDSCKTVVWPALCFGGTLLVVSRDTSLDPEKLGRLFSEHDIDLLKIAPSHLSALQTAPNPERFLPRKVLVFGGEASRWEWVSNFAETAPCRVFNHYGPTETTVGVVTHEVEKGRIKHQGPVPIGKPFANVQAYVLDKHLRPVPIGVVGELFFGGDCLARGYLNRPELTEEKFIPNPFFTTKDTKEVSTACGSERVSSENSSLITHHPSRRLYRTGDLARFLPDGNIEFLGRNDHQVKIRGYRIELGEIETALREIPEVSEALVTVKTDHAGEKRLVAYVVPRSVPSAVADGFTAKDAKEVSTVRGSGWVSSENSSLITHHSSLSSNLSRLLPEYMVPSSIVMLDALPRTPHGKIDLKALPEPEFVSTVSDDDFVAPRTELEKQLAEIWREVLGIERVGVRDDFFQIGGHSLLAVKLAARIKRETGSDLPLAILFQGATIEQLARNLSPESASEYSPVVVLQPLGSGTPIFLVHPLLGTVAPYRELARLLGSNRPTYGLQARGLDGKSSPFGSIEEAAQVYARAIVSVHPRGPYVIAGWSMGGYVAFETARILEEVGERVAMTAIFDTEVFGDGGDQFDEDEFLLMALDNRVEVSLERLRTLEGDEKLKYVWSEAEKSGRIPRRTGFNQLQAVFGVLKVHAQASRRYVPKPRPGKVVLFRTEENAPDSKSGWESVALGGVETEWIPGTHTTLLNAGNVEILAEKLKRRIEEGEK